MHVRFMIIMTVILIVSTSNLLYDDSMMSQTKTLQKRKIAVFFGGRSPEHDVSVITGLQVLDAVDSSVYEAFPVYISPEGVWYVGDLLRKRDNYMLNAARKAELTEVTLDVYGARGGVLIPKSGGGLFSKPKPIEFDVAIPAFHGLIGEDGNIQGAFELANVPYTGMRTKASAILMDKVATKYFLKGLDIPALPFATLRRPKDGGYLIPEKEIEEALAPLGYPCILKPANLGSSIGVAKVNNAAEVRACLPAIFEFDCAAIAEPFVKNLVEYNVAVSRVSGEIKTSAIERPKATDELLDFKQKYMSGGDDKSGNKLGGTKSASSRVSEGMLSLTREINPNIPPEMDRNIREWAHRMFDAIDGSGAPRIDFISDAKSGEIWMNEVNPCPGSFGYFLWEAASDPVFFTDLMTKMIEEAVILNAGRALPRDPVPQDARLLKR